MRRSERGFTLFEVLGAVALLALVYTTLASVAIRGVRGEAVSKRRLEASLLADLTLADLEMQIATEAVPELGVTHAENGSYRIEIEVTPYAMPALPVTGPDDAPLLEALMAAEGRTSPILQVSVHVSWLDREQEIGVRRTTFAVDSGALEASTAALRALRTQAGAGNPPGAGATPGGGNPSGAGAIPGGAAQ